MNHSDRHRPLLPSVPRCVLLRNHCWYSAREWQGGSHPCQSREITSKKSRSAWYSSPSNFPCSFACSLVNISPEWTLLNVPMGRSCKVRTSQPRPIVLSIWTETRTNECRDPLARICRYLQPSDDAILNHSVRTGMLMAGTSTNVFVDSTRDILVQASETIAQLVENFILTPMLLFHFLGPFVTDQLRVFQCLQLTYRESIIIFPRNRTRWVISNLQAYFARFRHPSVHVQQVIVGSLLTIWTPATGVRSTR